MARSSAASMTTASSGSRLQRNVTTQSSHAGVPCILQSSQLMVSVVMVTMMTRGYDNNVCPGQGTS